MCTPFNFQNVGAIAPEESDLSIKMNEVALPAPHAAPNVAPEAVLPVPMPCALASPRFKTRELCICYYLFWNKAS